jgi:pimeloyl-ACP methyl ester carboxylesterase
MRVRIGTSGLSYKEWKRPVYPAKISRAEDGHTLSRDPGMNRAAVAVFIATALLVGCSPAYKRLPTLDDAPELKTLARESQDRRHRIWNLQVGTAENTPYSIVAEETGSDREDELVVLIHGLMSSRTTWQFVSGHLGEHRRLWIPDQLGCGDSDRPAPETIDEWGYSPTGSARHLLEALRRRNDEAGWPDRIVIVGHSLGGAVALRILGSPELKQEFPRILERVDRAVLIAPLEFAVHRADVALSVLSRVGSFSLFLGRVTGYMKQLVARSLIEQAEYPDQVFRFDADRLLTAFDGKRNRRATQAIILQTAPFNLETKLPDWPRIERLVADYRTVEVPVLLIWGNRDETLPLAMGYKLAAELPDAQLHIVKGGKHSLQADRPVELADLIESFLRD